MVDVQTMWHDFLFNVEIVHEKKCTLKDTFIIVFVPGTFLRMTS